MCMSQIYTDLCSTKRKIKTKNTFVKVAYRALVVNMLTEHKKVCLSVNGAQSVKLEKATIEFKDYFKQIPVPFKNYADFECNLESVESQKVPTQKYIKITFLVVLLTSLFVLMINLPNQQLFSEVKILLMNLLKQFLKSISIVKK